MVLSTIFVVHKTDARKVLTSIYTPANSLLTTLYGTMIANKYLKSN